MSLSSEQLVITAEITRESDNDVLSATTGLSEAKESRLSDYLDAWEQVKNSFIKYGGEGVDFDQERKRQAIFYRVREMLGFPFEVYVLDGPTLEFIQLETGINF